jgi:hypothetical protein
MSVIRWGVPSHNSSGLQPVSRIYSGAFPLYNIEAATETDSAQALTKAKYVTLTPATETDSAQALSYGVIVTTKLGVAVQGSSNTNSQVKAVPLLPEGQVTPSRVITPKASFFQSGNLTPATETDQAQSLDVDKYVTLTSTAETDSSQSLDIDKYVTLSSATETDAAQSLNVDKYITLTPATETDSAQNLTFDQNEVFTIGVALQGTTNFDKVISQVPQPLLDSRVTASRIHSGISTPNIDPAYEVDVAQALSITKYVTLTPATETDTAQALNIDKSVVITHASESDAAQALDVDKYVTLSPSTETDTAQDLTTSQTVTPRVGLILQGQTNIGNIIREVDQPVLDTRRLVSASQSAITAPIFVTLTPAVETDVAHTLDFTAGPQTPKPGLITQGSGNMNRTVKAAPTIPRQEPKDPVPGVFVYFYSAPPIFNVITPGSTNQGYKFKGVSQETTTVLPSKITKRSVVGAQNVSITPATETDVAQTLNIDKQKTITPATEINVAHPLSYSTYTFNDQSIRTINLAAVTEIRALANETTVIGLASITELIQQVTVTDSSIYSVLVTDVVSLGSAIDVISIPTISEIVALSDTQNSPVVIVSTNEPISQTQITEFAALSAQGFVVIVTITESTQMVSVTSFVGETTVTEVVSEQDFVDFLTAVTVIDVIAQESDTNVVTGVSIIP